MHHAVEVHTQEGVPVGGGGLDEGTVAGPTESTRVAGVVHKYVNVPSRGDAWHDRFAISDVEQRDGRSTAVGHDVISDCLRAVCNEVVDDHLCTDSPEGAR